MNDAMPENWLPVDDYEGSYEISDLGRVRSLPRTTASGRQVRGCILKPQVHKVSGHVEVSLYGLVENGRSYWIHQLVARAFIGPCPPGQEVRHLDGNPANNRWAPGDEDEARAAGGNLFYGTRKENVADGIRHGTMLQVMSSQTHCIHGHEFTPENTIVRENGRGRDCRACHLDRANAVCLARREGITYQEALERVRAEQIGAEQVHVCADCGSTFETRRQGKLYCNAACRMHARMSPAMREREAARECELAGVLF